MAQRASLGAAAGLAADRDKLRGRVFGPPPGAGLTEQDGAGLAGLGGGYGGALAYVGRSADFGFGNWSWALLPPHLQVRFRDRETLTQP